METILFKIPKELKKEFQMSVLLNNTTMTEVLLKSIEEYISENDD